MINAARRSTNKRRKDEQSKAAFRLPTVRQFLARHSRVDEKI